MTANDGIRLIDARGHRCPTPTLKLRRAMAEAASGARLKLLCDDPMARIDVPHFVAERGADLIEMSETDGVFAFLVALR